VYILLHMQPRHTFSIVLHIVNVYGKCTGALIFEHFCLSNAANPLSLSFLSPPPSPPQGPTVTQLTPILSVFLVRDYVRVRVRVPVRVKSAVCVCV
jgi:hypothetical protein